jgi:hypothetical protein
MITDPSKGEPTLSSVDAVAPEPCRSLPLLGDPCLNNLNTGVTVKSEWGRVAEEPYRTFVDPADRLWLKTRTAEVVNAVRDLKIDTMVFLDKSARITAHMMREHWHVHHPGETPPRMFFLNIGNESFSRHLVEDSSTRFERIPQNLSSMGRALRTVFEAAKSSFEGKRVLVMDEFIWEGKSVELVS